MPAGDAYPAVPFPLLLHHQAEYALGEVPQFSAAGLGLRGAAFALHREQFAGEAVRAGMQFPDRTSGGFGRDVFGFAKQSAEAAGLMVE